MSKAHDKRQSVWAFPYCLLLCSLFLSAFSTSAQTWTHTWGGSLTDYAQGVAIDSSGNVYSVGQTYSFGAGGQDVLILKYSPTGTLLWAKTWGSSGDERAVAAGISPDGYLYVAGQIPNYIFVLKLDTNGNLQWGTTWGDPAGDSPADIGFDSLGNVYVLGTSTNNGAVVMKFSPSGGAPHWTASWMHPGSNNSGEALTVDASGNVIISGVSWDASGPPLHSTTFLVKFDASGNLLWTDDWVNPYPSDDEPAPSRGLTTDSQGNIYLTGHHTAACTNPGGIGLCDFDVMVLKFGPAGSFQWGTTWGGPGYDTGMSLALDPTGDVVVSGTEDVNGASPTPVVLTYDPNGNLLSAIGWQAQVPVLPGLANGPMVLDNFGNAYLVGQAVNNLGEWVQASGTEGILSNALVPYAYSTGAPVGQQAVLTNPPQSQTGGVIDTGGGGADSWIAFLQRTTMPAPVVTGVTPQNLSQTTNVLFTVSGNNFQSGSMLTFSDPGITVASYSQRTSNSIVAALSVSSTAEPGAATVAVTNPDGQMSNAGDLFVQAVAIAATQGTLGGGNTSNGNSTYNQVPGGEPVATGSGNYYYQHTDLVIPGRGKPLLFQRTYNTLDSYSGPLGANWTHSYNIVLSPLQNSVVTIKWGDGHVEDYTWNGSVFLAQPGVCSALTLNPDSSYTLVSKDQTQYVFSSSGTLLSIFDRNGNATQLAYDAAGRLIAVTGAGGRSLAFSYDSSNRIVQVADPAGRSVKFGYDGNSNLIQATDPAGGVTAFTYDPSHRVLSATLPNSKLLLQNIYDSQSRVISQTNGNGNTWTFAYGAPNPTDTTITDGRGNKSIHTYDSLLRIVQIRDPLNGTINYAYDSNNNRTAITNQDGNTTALSYDAQGNVTSIVNPLGDSGAFTYDGKNDLLSATDPKGNATNLAYDANGNLLSVTDALGEATSFSYDGFGELASKKDQRGNVTGYAYDSFGNLVQITDALGHATTLAYDGISRLASITDANGHSTSAAYDALSRLTTVTDALNHKTLLAYDPLGNLLKVTDANGHATSYSYDALNNLVTVTDALAHVTSYAYDADNNRISFKNAKGNVTAYVFDALNRLTSSTDPLGFATSYAYDAAGNVVSVTDAKAQTNKFSYDPLNRLTGISYADGASVSYAYDADGNRAQMVDPHGTTSYRYDQLNRLTQVANPGSQLVNYSYDRAGNRSSIGYPDGSTVSYSYDALNRLSQAADAQGKITSYQYDPVGSLLRVAYPNNTSISYAYDQANRLVTVVNSSRGVPLLNLAYSLDAIGNRTNLSVDGIVTNFSYDALNELTGARLGFLKTTWAYDAVGNRAKQTGPLGTINYTYDPGDRLLAAGASAYTYDADGNVISISKNAQGLPVAYQFNAANRLVAAQVGKTVSTFSYDGDGNRIAQSVPAGTYSYVNDVATALPVVLSEQGPDGAIDYTYGLNLIEESNPKFDYFYHYDGLGSVVALTDLAGIPQAAYAYDPWGNSLLNVTDNVGTKNKFRFTGEALDSGTQLYYLRARYYDSNVGRFLARDPLTGIARHPLSKNRYVYAFSSPISFVDKSGLAAEGSQFQSFLPPSANLGNAGSTLALAPTPCSNCVPFALVGNVAALGGDLYKAVTGNAIPGLDLVGVGLDISQRLQDGENFGQALVNAAASYAISSSIGLAAKAVAGTGGGAIVLTAYDATKLGASIGSIPAVEAFVSQQEFSALNWAYGSQQWSTSPFWTNLSNFGAWLPNLP